jgi:hypothetical protein
MTNIQLKMEVQFNVEALCVKYTSHSLQFPR